MVVFEKFLGYITSVVPKENLNGSERVKIKLEQNKQNLKET